MITFVIFCISFVASLIGALCGIGGGVVIKPLVDALGVMEVPTVSFLSGCTVLSMTTYSVLKNKLSGGEGQVSSTTCFLAAGAAVGGVLGKDLFSYSCSHFLGSTHVGAVQAAVLSVITVGALVYTHYRNKVKTLSVRNPLACIAIGVILGLLSSFLGIGGGPINLVVFYFFFSENTKEAALNSLYVIFFSQLASLLAAFLTGTIPCFDYEMLILMMLGGIAGGIAGRKCNEGISEERLVRLFSLSMVVIIGISLYNIYKYL